MERRCCTCPKVMSFSGLTEGRPLLAGRIYGAGSSEEALMGPPSSGESSSIGSSERFPDAGSGAEIVNTGELSFHGNGNEVPVTVNNL